MPIPTIIQIIETIIAAQKTPARMAQGVIPKPKTPTATTTTRTQRAQMSTGTCVLPDEDAAV